MGRDGAFSSPTCKELDASILDSLDLGIPILEPQSGIILCAEILKRIDALAEIVDHLPLLQDPLHEATLLRSSFMIFSRVHATL